MKKIVTLGEIMLRLSASVGDRLSSAETLRVHYGGGEANVAASLAQFGYHAYFVSKVPENPLGQGALRHLRAQGVHPDYVLTGGSRLGTYYLESGNGERSTQVLYDRKYSSFSMMTIEELDFEEIFRDAALFHVSGITLALSATLRELVLVAFQKAKELGVKVSLDFNYRATLWSHQEASEALRPLLPYVDICSFGELDAIHLLGLEKSEERNSREEQLSAYYRQVQERYPNIAYMYATFRAVHTASHNDLQGNLFVDGILYQSKLHQMTNIVDRVGGGDAFAAGVLYGILEMKAPEELIAFATASSALKHTISGDCNAFSVEEIHHFIQNGSGKICR